MKMGFQSKTAKARLRDFLLPCKSVKRWPPFRGMTRLAEELDRKQHSSSRWHSLTLEQQQALIAELSGHPTYNVDSDLPECTPRLLERVRLAMHTTLYCHPLLQHPLILYIDQQYWSLKTRLVTKPVVRQFLTRIGVTVSLMSPDRKNRAVTQRFIRELTKPRINMIKTNQSIGES